MKIDPQDPQAFVKAGTSVCSLIEVMIKEWTLLSPEEQDRHRPFMLAKAEWLRTKLEEIERRRGL